MFPNPPDNDSSDAVSLSSSYTVAVDIWALGEIVFRMITHSPAFSDPRDMYNYVVAGRSFPLAPLQQREASNSCCDFVELTMARAAKDRPTAQTTASHPWLGRPPLDVQDSDSER